MTESRSTGGVKSVQSRRSRTSRQGNTQLVLQALRTQGPSSQRTISRSTGLPPATINNIVKSLRRDGLADVRWINGREALVTLVAKQGAVASVQVTPERVHCALFFFSKQIRYDAVNTSTNLRGEEVSQPSAVLDVLADVTKQAGMSVAELTGVSIAMQAPIDCVSGGIASWAASRLPEWKDVPLRSFFEKQVPVPLVVDNDANLAALAEWTWGAGRGANDFLYLACSEQIGGGLVLNGRPYRGGDGMAGELGHMVIDPTGSVCFCGNRGCLTTLASERAILAALESSHAPRISLREVIEHARAGDPACQRVLFEVGRHLGRASANAAKILSPRVIVIGGTLGEAGPLVFDGLLSSAEINNLKVVSPTIRFSTAEIRTDATLLGGVAAVLSDLGPGISELPPWMTLPSGS